MILSGKIVQPPISHSTSKKFFLRKSRHRSTPFCVLATTLAWLKSSLQFDVALTWKCEEIFQKRTAEHYNPNTLDGKNGQWQGKGRWKNNKCTAHWNEATNLYRATAVVEKKLVLKYRILSVLSFSFQRKRRQVLWFLRPYRRFHSVFNL